MQQENLRQLQQWYEQSEDAVLFYASDGTRIGNNAAAEPWTVAKDCPLPWHKDDGEIRYGTFVISHGGELYLVQQALRTWGEQELVLVQICTQPVEKLLWECKEKQQENENEFALLQQEVFGITGAVSTLYEVLEAIDDEMLETDPLELMEQLNIIQGNCCRMEQPYLLWSETVKYYRKDDIAEKIILLDRAAASFVDSCRRILGRTVRVRLEREAVACVSVNPERLHACLLCIVLLLLRRLPNANQITLTQRQEGDIVVLCFTATEDGSEQLRHRHSIAAPLYKTTLLSAEEKIIRLFCETYHVTALRTFTAHESKFSLRFPFVGNREFPSVEDTQGAPRDEMFSLYSVFLSEISGYRFY